VVRARLRPLIALTLSDRQTPIEGSAMSTKVYQVYIAANTESASYLLADATREEFMGVPCIKGTYRPHTSSSHWLAGQVIYIPLDKVLTVIEYESFEAYRDALKRHYDEKSK
jgi:hypothetical protein